MKIKIIYNPKSGKNKGLRNIKIISDILLDNGHLVSRFATQKIEDVSEQIILSEQYNYDLIIIAGGDGTINEAASTLAKENIKIPLGIYSFGTVNDFARYLNLSNDPEEFCEMIERMNIIDVDLGKVDGKYFVNVAAGGFLTSVAHETPREMKAVLGKNAYYLHGLRQLSQKGIYTENLTIKTEDQEISGEFYLFLVSNSPSVGGFEKFLPDAKIQDGLLDCVFVKKSNFTDAVEIISKVLSGKHVDNENVLYFKTKKIEIINNKDKEIEYDIDGEYGGHLPITIEVVHKALKVLV